MLSILERRVLRPSILNTKMQPICLFCSIPQSRFFESAQIYSIALIKKPLSNKTHIAVTIMSASSSNSRNSRNSNTSNPPPPSTLISRISSLASPRSVFVSPRSQSVSLPPKSPALLERKTTTLAFLRSPDTLSRKLAVQTDAFGDLLKLKKLTTIVRPGQKDVFNAPAFRLVPYGKVWHKDIIVFFTNALRYETKNLFFVLYCLHERSQSLEEGDIESFFEWFTPYHNFFTTVVSVIHATFLPWIERSADLPEPSSRSFFVSQGSHLSRVLQQTIIHKRHFLKKYTTTKAAEKLRTIFTDFAVKLLDYLSKMDSACSRLAEANYSVAECRQISRSLVSEMATMPNFKKNIVLLLRWLENKPETSAAWRREHLNPRSGLSYARWKRPGAQEECMEYFVRKCAAIPENFSP